MRTPLIAGNWKMHKNLAEARELVSGLVAGLPKLTGLDRIEAVICPPFQHLFPMAKAIAGTSLTLGAQNAHFEDQGAFTGEVSVPMLKETGCTHVIIGHSERRQYFGEAGELLSKKVRAVVKHGLTAIYCVGETLSQREADDTGHVITQQIRDVVGKDLPPARLVIAYEPVWAIGTGKTATPDQAQAVHALIRTEIAAVFGQSNADAVRILYGGSVKPDNASALLSQPDIDGALVGGACLVAADFLAILGAGASSLRAK